jgi:hypothetical protein
MGEEEKRAYGLGEGSTGEIENPGVQEISKYLREGK